MARYSRTNKDQLCASVENLGLICADLITVSSQAMHEDLMDRHLPLRGNVEVVNNAVDLERFHRCADWPADDGYILFVGRLTKQKGVEYLLRAFTYVHQKFSDVRLKIVGDGELKAELEWLRDTLMISDRVDFLGWKEPCSPELVGLYQKARAVAIPSIYEPFGMIALESLACQRPVVASKCEGLAEIVRHGETGYLFEPEDKLDLAQWLMALLFDPDLAARMGQAGRAWVEDEDKGYTWPRVASHFIYLYKNLLKIDRIDLSIPPRAKDFRDQIVSVAKKMSPPLGEAWNTTLEHLFDWMKQR